MAIEDKKNIGIKTILRIPFFVILQTAILFISAGRIDIPRAWIFVLIISLQFTISFSIMYKLNPELIKQRARGFGQNTKPWDKVLMPVSVIMSFVVLQIIIGLDVGRFYWSNLGIEFLILGVFLYIIGTIFSIWTVVVNPYYEPTVRIQSERDHKVITIGPYKIIRHPGYAGAIIVPFSISLIVGSFFGLIPAGIIMLLIIIRTYLEDKTLVNELDGYFEYTQRVKYRLVPGIW